METGKPHEVPEQALLQPAPAEQPDLRIDGDCIVVSGKKYFYANVNIRNGGKLSFPETPNSPTDFWASSIIIENGGAMTAGETTPFGTNGGTLTMHIYGKDQSAGDPVKNPGQGVRCRTHEDHAHNIGPCGIPWDKWTDNGKTLFTDLPGNVTDYFYQYGPLYGDGRCDNEKVWVNGKCPDNPTPPPNVPVTGKVGYFGYKVLAVSFGGTLVLRGYKGAVDSDYRCPNSAKTVDNDPLCSAVSWIRLSDGATLAAGKKKLTLERDPENWQKGDQIVVTTTDYLPSHSEQLQVDNPREGAEVNFHTPTGPTQWLHNGIRYGGGSDTEHPKLTARLPARITIDDDTKDQGAETRAAVALLTRSIRIVSAGDVANEDFKTASNKTTCAVKTVWNPNGIGCYYFGAHSVVRQGFKKFQVQGVEFAKMGQGGRLAHYPVHFHMVRQTPQGDGGTYVKDSSVNESMTRWYVIHSTQGVTLARNVGYKSIGHGYYLEDATETKNKFYSNIGILARAAVLDKQNDRQVPGILSDNTDPFSFVPPNVANQGFPYRSDNEHPTVFWITNGWNDFIGNMAAGAGTCGAAYWFVPAANSDMPDVMNGNMHMKWSGYAALQMTHTIGNNVIPDLGYAGTTPLRSFYKNYATSAMHSFQTTADAPDCSGIVAFGDTTPNPSNLPRLRAVQSIAPAPVRHTVMPPKMPPHTEPDNFNDPYYPHVIGGARHATTCPLAGGKRDCSQVLACASGGTAEEQCTVTVLDHFTSAFNWANGNVSAVWLRPQWFLLDNSVISDVQNGGLTFITGGDYTHASIIQGYWALARNTLFIGNTQTGNAYASNAGPFKPSDCAINPAPAGVPNYCLNSEQGISLPLISFFVNQRLSNIYDGPSYEDSNAYLDITKTPCALSDTGDCMYAWRQLATGITKNPQDQSCYLPNAAIAWKQPNGFFYPPAFHTTNLFFDNVDIRHYVIDPLFKVGFTPTDPKQDFGQGGTYITDFTAVDKAYCTKNSALFDNFTAIDRQTELNDDDGSLTGLSNSLVNPPNPTLKQTISVNEDTFFAAPVETPECESNIGTNVVPANACTAPVSTQPLVTANTSPFDYVATVVYHLSADPGTGNQPGTDPWGIDCSNPGCYGVPLYRQFLSGTKGANEATSTREWAHWFHNKCDKASGGDPTTAQCRWPFIRMAGAAISQRETLTINNGTYYLDTTVSLNTQQTEPYTLLAPNARFLNVFTPNETYYVFFLYAKQSTKQTYQIYVGTGFDTTTLKAQQVNIDSALTPSTPTSSSWLKPDTSHVKTDGIIEVTVDFKGVTDLDPTPGNGLCQPHQFCKQSGNSCVSALAATDPLLVANPNLAAEAAAVCGQWAVKDLDCPAKGCFGFSFTIPSTSFTADSKYRRPDPKVFPTTADTAHQPDWTTKFTRTSTAPDNGFTPINGPRPACFYEKLPGTDCPVP
jgi:hypothetical protein